MCFHELTKSLGDTTKILLQNSQEALKCPSIGDSELEPNSKLKFAPLLDKTMNNTVTPEIYHSMTNSRCLSADRNDFQ